MELMDAILQRRSIRKYKNEDIPVKKLEQILQAGLLAPSSRNLRPCRLVLIRDRNTLEKLSGVKKTGGAMLTECNAAIAVLADSEKADTWIEDSSIALAYMNLMAASLEVGSCWCQIHLRATASGKDAEAAVREILSASERFRIVGILALGIPLEAAAPHSLGEADLGDVLEWPTQTGLE